MKIALFNWRDLAHPASGGAEVFTEQVLQRWAQWGHDVTLFSSAVDGRPAEEHADGVRYVRGGSRFGVYREARRWWREVGADAGFDLVIDEVNTRPFGCHRWVTGVPVVALMHQLAREVWFFEMPLPAALLGRYVLEPRWLRSMRHVPVMTISDSSRASLVDNGLQRVSVVPVGIAPDADQIPTQVAPSNPTVVFVGRMAANKRPHHAVRAVEIARQFIPNLEIHLVGDGPLRAGLARRGDHVVAHGFVSAAEKRRIVANAHAQLVTSVREGWGLVVDEAARLGTPSFAYDVAGLCDSVAAADGHVVQPRP
ncbi:MAG: glycosyltransferase family 4 protein, partial [Acidimicrobiales bacterium]|nr:glycosyltransferase family 4 protein [Acidimicrobiales bacterium]